MNLLLGIVGLPASGKSTVAEHWKSKPGVVYIHMSDFIWAALEKQGVKASNFTGSMYGLYFHEILKDKPIIHWTNQQIKKNKSARVVLLDSVRSLEQHQHFKKKYKNYKLVAVLASPEERYKREIKRKRFGEVLTRKDCEVRDRDELSRGLADVIAMADFYIDANCRVSEMTINADKLLSKLMR